MMEKYGTMTKFFSSGLNSMLAFPEETIRGVGENPENFHIRKRKFPLGVYINKNEISPFPVLHVQDKAPIKWLNQFKEQYGKKTLDFFMYELFPQKEKAESFDNLPF